MSMPHTIATQPRSPTTWRVAVTAFAAVVSLGVLLFGVYGVSVPDVSSIYSSAVLSVVAIDLRLGLLVVGLCVFVLTVVFLMIWAADVGYVARRSYRHTLKGRLVRFAARSFLSAVFLVFVVVSLSQRAEMTGNGLVNFFGECSEQWRFRRVCSFSCVGFSAKI